ncbi:MAG: class I SAM-dependent methyltransferase, partial [Sphingomonadales bacterium]
MLTVTMAAISFPAYDPSRVDAAPSHPEDHGVTLFPAVSMAEDAETLERLERLVMLAREKGWRSALDEAGGDADTIAYVTSEDRLGFFDILPLAPDQALLEIGASLGQIAIPLARRVATVDALEVVSGQAQFCAERARQEGLANIRVAAGGADCRLPFGDASFDGAVLNLVLEWCADREGADHEAAQRRLLGEIARVLKPGGFLFLQTKNRYALRLLLGGRDEHMFGLRWGSTLPRWLGRIVAGGRRPNGWLHSYPHLAAMIAKAGFSRTEGYWAAPEMRRPQKLVPLDPASVRAFRRGGGIAQGETRKTRLLMALLPARLVRYVTPGLTGADHTRRKGQADRPTHQRRGSKRRVIIAMLPRTKQAGCPQQGHAVGQRGELGDRERQRQRDRTKRPEEQEHRQQEEAEPDQIDGEHQLWPPLRDHCLDGGKVVEVERDHDEQHGQIDPAIFVTMIEQDSEQRGREADRETDHGEQQQIEPATRGVEDRRQLFRGLAPAARDQREEVAIDIVAPERLKRQRQIDRQHVHAE